jgi:hypothetical protein
MSRYISTGKRNICPICDDGSGKCRTFADSANVLCMNSPEGFIEVSGYKFIHSSKDGLWGVYVVDNGQTYSNEAKQHYRAQRIEREAVAKRKQAESLSLIERDREYRKLISQLSLNDRAKADLLRRGLTPKKIQRMLFASVGKWHPLSHAMTTELPGVIGNGDKLNVMADGYLVPIPNIDGLIVGAQYRVFEPIDGNKYPWLTSKTKNNEDGPKPNLPNGELPIGVYRPENLTNVGVVGIIEGYLKPSIACDNLGHICLGVASGNFAASPEQLEQALKQIEIEQGIKPRLLLYADAGSAQNDHVMRTYHRTHALANKLGYELKVAWYQQFSKVQDQDIDEIDLETISQIREISWYEFLGLQHKALADESLSICERYLPDFDIPDTAKLIALKSPKGTGKTEYLAKYIEENREQKRLVICHRSQLTEQLGHRLGLRTHYELENAKGEYRKAIVDEIRIFGMVITWDSLHKINLDDWKECEIILDEAEQSLWHLLNASTEIEDRRIDTLKMLSQLLENCERTWLLDADLTNIAIEFIAGLSNRNDFQPHIIVNKYLFTNPWEVTMYNEPTPAGLTQSLWKHLDSGKTALVHLDSQKSKGKYSGINLEKQINKKYPHLKTLLVDSFTIQNPDHPAYRILTAKDICSRLSVYDVVICTPTIETGVDIKTHGLFDAVFGIFYGVVSADSARQALSRYREPVARHVWAAIFSQQSGDPDWQQNLKIQSAATKKHIRNLQDADTHIDTNYNAVCLKTWAKIQARVKADAITFKMSIINGLRGEGHNVNGVEALCKQEQKEIDEIMTANRDESYLLECEAISNEDTIDDEQAKHLEELKARTKSQSHQLRKHKLIKSYGVTPTPDLIKADDNGLYGKLKLFYYLTEGRKYLKSRDKEKLAKKLLNTKGEVWQPTANKTLLQGKIDLLDKLAIVKILMQPDKDYRDKDEDLNRFKKLVIKHQYEIKMMFGIKINPHNTVIAIANQMLKLMGLKLQATLSRVRLANGKMDQRVYRFIPITENDRRHRIIQNWLRNDAQKMEQKTAKSIAVSNSEPDPPTVIIDIVTNAGSNSSGSTPVTDLFPVDHIPPDPLEVQTIPAPATTPQPHPQPQKVQWRVGMVAMYQGSQWVIKQLGTQIAFICRNGLTFIPDISELSPVPI